MPIENICLLVYVVASYVIIFYLLRHSDRKIVPEELGLTKDYLNKLGVDEQNPIDYDKTYGESFLYGFVFIMSPISFVGLFLTWIVFKIGSKI